MAEPFYADEQITLYHGDALDVLSALPAGSVDCCVTSPPYYGLRDYGTGQWVGGDPSCGHDDQRRVVPGASAVSRLDGGRPPPVPAPTRSANCRCGAQRVDQQYGLEPSPAAYVETMRAVFAQVRRVLADDGTCWLNLGDSYSSGEKPGTATTGSSSASTLTTSSRRGAWAPGNVIETFTKPGAGLPAKNLLGMPWRVAFALQDDGWILRNAVVWDKPNPMPESVTDRLSTTYELVFLLVKSRRYRFDLDAVREPLSPDSGSARHSQTSKSNVQGLTGLAGHRGFTKQGHDNGRNPGDVWTLPTQPFPASHFAVMAPELARRCIVAGCKPGGVVLDPFAGSGTTGMVAQQHGRRFVGIDLSADYLNLALRTRLAQTAILDEVVA